MGIQLKNEDSLDHFNMLGFKTLLLVAAVSAAPMDDTVEVKAAKAEFKAAFDMAAAGDHAKLAPVNNDVQAEQIPMFYIADTEDVAAAKAEFDVAFKDAAAGGLAAKQAPAPVHKMAAPMVQHNVMPFNYAVNPYTDSYGIHHPVVHHPFTYTTYGMPYYHVPVVGVNNVVVGAENEVKSE